jgi:3-deoxy-D-manno-octulosonic-acid transferase
MFRIVYGFIISLYFFLILLASPFHKKARLWIRGRKATDRLLRERWPVEKKVAWFHCASLGEFEQGRPVIEAFRSQRPDVYILITFFSPSGYEIRKNYSGADQVIYLPIDIKRKARMFIAAIQPHWAVFVKYEFWYNLLTELHKKNIPAYLISASFRPSSWFFNWYGKSFLNILTTFDHLFVQNTDSANLLAMYGIANVTVSGDTRFDRVHQIARNHVAIPRAEAFKNGHYLAIAGSTWKEDEDLLIRYINQDAHGEKWILAPHEIHESHIHRITSNLTVPYVRFSQFDKPKEPDPKVLIIDNIGLLSSLYKYGNIAYIGGGFGKGIHNVLEPAAFGLPVIFGPRFHKFQEAVGLIKQGGGFPIQSYEELMNTLDSFFNNPKAFDECGNHSEKFIKDHLGATKIIVDKLLTV